MAEPMHEEDMLDSTAGAEQGESKFGEADKEEPITKTIRILPGSTESAASFEFTNEDHTLGNALRHVIMKNPDVEFCSYSIPHPAESKMHLRIQAYGKTNVQDILEKGLDDLSDLCDVITEKFEAAREDYHKRNPR